MHEQCALSYLLIPRTRLDFLNQCFTMQLVVYNLQWKVHVHVGDDVS